MKIQNITDVEKFFEVVDQCKGTVELVSPEGDRINLKSKLAQYLSRIYQRIRLDRTRKRGHRTFNQIYVPGRIRF